MAWTPHTLVTFGGALNANQDPPEIWVCGVRVTAVGGGPLGNHADYLASISNPLQGWFASGGNNQAASGFPQLAQLKWAKANAIAASGKYADPNNVHVHDYPAPVAGGEIADNCTADILSICLSWQTAKAVRKGSYASHGRIYPPNYVHAGDKTSMRVTASTPHWATKGKDLLALLAAGPEAAIPVVASGHGGEIEPIIGCRVGDVMDVQRRRKDALKEVYSLVPFP